MFFKNVHFVSLCSTRREHAVSLFLKEKLLLLQFLHCEENANFMHNINLNFALTNTSILFSRIFSVHSYSTRSSTSACFAKQSALVQSEAFSRVGVNICNGIPTSLKNFSNNSFKKAIKACSNGSNILVKHYQTLLDATCLIRSHSTIKHVG